MEVVIVPRATYAQAWPLPWHELIVAARRGEHGMSVWTEYTKHFRNPKTGEPESKVEPIMQGAAGSPTTEVEAWPKQTAVLYEHPRLGTAVHYQNWID